MAIIKMMIMIFIFGLSINGYSESMTRMTVSEAKEYRAKYINQEVIDGLFDSSVDKDNPIRKTLAACLSKDDHLYMEFDNLVVFCDDEESVNLFSWLLVDQQDYEYGVLKRMAISSGGDEITCRKGERRGHRFTTCRVDIKLEKNDSDPINWYDKFF